MHHCAPVFARMCCARILNAFRTYDETFAHHATRIFFDFSILYIYVHTASNQMLLSYAYNHTLFYIAHIASKWFCGLCCCSRYWLQVAHVFPIIESLGLRLFNEKIRNSVHFYTIYVMIESIGTACYSSIDQDHVLSV